MSLVNVNLRPSLPGPQEADRADEEGEEKRQVAMDGLGSYLRGRFEEWKTARQNIEDQWLEDLRAYNGIFEQGQLDKYGEGGNPVYVNITRTKTQAAYARMVDLLFQAGQKAWGIDPTPIPEMENGTVVADPQTGEQRELTPEEVTDIAEKAAAEMEKEMEDQLVEAGYEGHAKTALLELAILGTGCVKGITTEVERKQFWQRGKDGWVVEVEDMPKPAASAPSIFDIYPDGYAICKRDCRGFFERHVLTRQQFRDLAKLPGFDTEKIEQVIRDNPGGNYTPMPHERELRNMAGYTADTGEAERYEVLEYWGDVPADRLTDVGFEGTDELDPTMDVSINAWFSGSATVRARPNPTKPEDLPYNLVPYERIPHQLWGRGVPRQMRDGQETINDGVHYMRRNLAISSGPMVEINMDLLAEGEDPRDLHAWRVLLREGGDAQYPMVRFFQPTNITAYLGELVEMFRRFVDEETSLPSYTHGQHMPGLNKTAAGMSMLMGAANVVLKSVIKNIDDFMTRPMIESLYHWNMRWNEREDIKGDMEVRARGASVLVAKEVQSQRLIQFMSLTANPVDGQLTERAELLRAVAEALDIDANEVVKTDDEIQAIAAATRGGGGPAGDGQPGMAAGPEAPGGAPGVPAGPAGELPAG